MIRKSFLLFFIVIAITAPSAYSQAQPWSGVLDPARAIDWTQAGAGTIPNRTTICSTLNPGATGAQITTAVSSCSSSGGGVVFLNAGSYSVTSITMASNVTLRGAGPQGAANGGTDVKLTAGTSCGGLGGNVCIWNGNGSWSGAPDNTANWTAGYAKGTTSITLSGHANLLVGSQLILDQLNDGTSPSQDTGNIFVCGTTSCSQQGQTNGRGGNRGTVQVVTVTGINGSTVTINPGIYMPNIRTSQSPGAWWASALPITGVGIENLTIDVRGTSTNGAGIYFYEATKCWVKNIRSLNDGSVHKHIWLYPASHITVRDSYFYGANGTSESYGVDAGGQSSDNLVENNIFQHITGPTITEEDMGSVFAYNYAVDHYYNNGDPAWQQDTADNHDAGAAYELWEGNIGDGIKADDIHGNGNLYTNFRNRWSGRDTTSKNEETIAIELMYGMRYYNIVGNVLGTSGYHTNYQEVPSSTSDRGNSSVGDVSIYTLGYSGDEGTIFSGVPNDLLTASTLMRWGNYDTVNNAVRWVAVENASAAPGYPGLSSPSQTLPPSFYLSAKPSWWGSVPWPAIGPDVTGGNIANVGGYAYLTPAANCYLTTMGGKTDGSSGILTFNASSCYSSAALPAAPTKLTATVGVN